MANGELTRIIGEIVARSSTGYRMALLAFNDLLRYKRDAYRGTSGMNKKLFLKDFAATLINRDQFEASAISVRKKNIS